MEDKNGYLYHGAAAAFRMLGEAAAVRPSSYGPSSYFNSTDLNHSLNSSELHSSEHGSEAHHTVLGFWDLLKLLVFLLAIWGAGQGVSFVMPAIVRRRFSVHSLRNTYPSCMLPSPRSLRGLRQACRLVSNPSLAGGRAHHRFAARPTGEHASFDRIPTS